jgi:heme A synthase
METVKVLHQYWAYLVLLVLVLATFNAIFKTLGKKEYEPRDFRVSLFTLIVSHIQLLIGIALWFSADYFSELSMGEIMKNAALRSNVVEHPVAMLLAVVFITIGYSKHKKQLSSAGKLKKIAIFYSIALLLVCAKIPWDRLF